MLVAFAGSNGNGEARDTSPAFGPVDPQRIMSASEFRIDVLGMPNNPPYGTSMSRMTNIALVTDMAHNAMTMVLRVFGGARKPKVPNKMRSQNTKTQ